MLAYVLVGLADAYAIRMMGFPAGSIMHTLSILFFLPPLLLFPWVFAFLSRFENTVKGTLKFSCWLMLHHVGKTVLLVIIMLLFLLFCWLIPFLVPILPAAVCLIMSLIIEPVFRILQQETPDRNPDTWYNE